MDLIVLFAVCTAVVWGLVFALRCSLLVASVGYLVVAAVFGYQFLRFDVAGISMSIDRVLLLGLLIAFALQCKLNLAAFRKWSMAEYLLLAFVAILLVSTFSHDWHQSAKNQDPIVQHLIEGYLIPVALFWIARHATYGPRQINVMYFILGVFGVYLAVTAICEVAGVWGLVFPRYIADPTVGIHFGRARGPFLQSVRLGIYLIAGLAAVWIPLVYQRRQGRPGILLGLVSSVVISMGILLTLTRSIWMGLALGFLTVVSFTFTPRLRRFTVYFLVVGTMFAVPLKDSLLSFQREYGSQETLESTRMRAVFAYVSWLMIKERPLSGFGFGHFPHLKDAYLNDRQTDLNLNSIRGYIHHNTFLSLFVELGFLGLLAYLGLLWQWGRQAILLWKDQDAPAELRGQALFLLVLLGCCVTQMLFHEVSYTVFENGILFLSAGLVSGMAAMRGLRSRRYPRQKLAVGRILLPTA